MKIMENKRVTREISLGPCPADQFSGRNNERKKLKEVLLAAKDRAQVVLVSGMQGSGKSSILNWAENEIYCMGCPAIRKGFNETPGMVAATYRELLIALKEYKKLGWFAKALEESKIREYLDLSLSLLEKISFLAGPSSPMINAGTAVIRECLPGGTTPDYDRLRSSFDSILKGVSEELGINKIVGILLDDIQWSCQPDFQLLKDLMRDLPPRIVLIIALEVEDKSIQRYAELKKEIYRFYYLEIKLRPMEKEDIQEFAKRRYCLSLDDQSANFLSKVIGDPFCLAICINNLQRQKLEPILINFEKVAPQAIEKAADCLYSGLDETWQKRINSLCILIPPIPFPIISCMLSEKNVVKLKDDLKHSLFFINDEQDTELYHFANPALREYRKNELPKSEIAVLSSKALKCYECLGEDT